MRGLLASCKSLLLFVLLIFVTSSVGRLWICSCLGRFLCLGLFGSMWSFLWSSIRVRVLFVGICSFLVLVCREWRWISWTRNHVFDHGLALSCLIFFNVVSSKSMCISAFGHSSSPSNSFVILLMHSGISLCFLVAIFLTKIVWFLLHLVVGMFWGHLLPFVGGIFFRCFGMFCFVCIVLPFVNIFLIFLLSPVIFGLFPQYCIIIFSCVAFFFLSLHVPAFSLCFWPVFVDFFICVSSRNSHPGFDFFFVLFEGIPIFSQTNFAPA